MTEDLRNPTDLARQLHKLNQRLHVEYNTLVGPEVVDQCFGAAERRVERSRVPDFKLLLVERYVREGLKRRVPDDDVHA